MVYVKSVLEKYSELMKTAQNVLIDEYSQSAKLQWIAPNKELVAEAEITKSGRIRFFVSGHEVKQISGLLIGGFIGDDFVIVNLGTLQKTVFSKKER